MRFTTHTEIACAADVAFENMADARNEVHWNSQVSQSELLTGDGVSEGSVFRTVNRGKPYRATITTADPPRRLVFDVDGKQMDIVAEFSFVPRGDATSLDATFDMQPKGFLKLMSPVLKRAIARDLEQQTRQFKEFCERR